MSSTAAATGSLAPLVRLDVTADAQIATITLNRPAARNALSRALCHELATFLATIADTPAIRAVILTGAGEQAFCAGADLRERETLTPTDRTAHTRLIGDVVEQLAALPVPVLAAIRGFALAGGAELALACDLRIAATDAVLGFPEVKIGIFPGAGGVYRLPRVVSAGLARELLFTGRHIAAAEAHAAGLIDHLVAPADVLDTAAALAASIATAAPLAVRAVKQALAASQGLADAPARLAVDQFRPALDPTADYAEGLAAFRERRPPDFTGR